uniref:J domain-containing protein n=1 Tax=Parastrongyloides trichosuri TaxID=131310 RepID=A0A0N4ZVF1_PARTI
MKFPQTISLSKVFASRNITTSMYLRRENLYKILGISKKSSERDIKNAYFKKAKLLHPDSLDHSLSDSEKEKKHEEFMKIKFAYDILKKPHTKKLYDNGHDPNLISQNRIFSRNAYKSSKSRQAFYENYHYNTNDWSAFYSENINSNKNTEEIKKRDAEQWRRILIFTSIGALFVFIYDIGYYFLQVSKENKIRNLSKKDEIARSYIRQFGKMDKLNDREELDKYGKVFSEDIEEVYRQRMEEGRIINDKEIREESRWFEVLKPTSWVPRTAKDKREIENFRKNDESY